MTLVGAIVGGMGLVSILLRRTLLGLMIGIQLLVLGATLTFVVVGISANARPSGHLFALFVVLSAVAQLVGGYALAIRRFYLKNNVLVDELRSLKK